MSKTPEEKRAIRKARRNEVLSELSQDASEALEDFISFGHVEAVRALLEPIEELEIITSLRGPARDCVRGIRALLYALESIPKHQPEDPFALKPGEEYAPDMNERGEFIG